MLTLSFLPGFEPQNPNFRGKTKKKELKMNKKVATTRWLEPLTSEL